jgi:hypothetical protein
MKIWHGFGSEHSANLVMIGQFKDVTDAARAKEVIDRITARVQADAEEGQLEVGGHTDRYTDAMLDLLAQLRVHSILPAELEQFAYDVRLQTKGNQVVIRTDEVDVSAFMKVLLDKGARVEVFSADRFPQEAGDDEG